MRLRFESKALGRDGAAFLPGVSSKHPLTLATCTFFKEKLQIAAHFWYKVSRSERV